MWGAYVAYPEYRSKNRHVNTLEERIQDCFRYSMNGGPPAADSPTTAALLDYFHGLATGLPAGITPKGAGYPELPTPHESPSILRAAWQPCARNITAPIASTAVWPVGNYWMRPPIPENNHRRPAEFRLFTRHTKMPLTGHFCLARLERFELPTPWFVARYSIQLSYRRKYF